MTIFPIKSLVAATVLVCLGSTVDEALALNRVMSHFYPPNELFPACESAGGAYSAGITGYGCEKACDGKDAAGNQSFCTITCLYAEQQCISDTPARIGPQKTINGVLGVRPTRAR